MIFLSVFLSACHQNIFSKLQQNLSTEDTQRAERLTKEALAAAAEAETAATALQAALQQHSTQSQVPIYQVYSQAEYDQKISALQHSILAEMKKLNNLKDAYAEEQRCQTSYLLFKQLYDLIYYNPEYATPKIKLDAHLHFFLSHHQHWSQSCKK